MQRAKINFYPKNNETGYCVDKLNIIDKSSDWTMDTSYFKEDGYIFTDFESNIATVNSKYWFKLKADSGFKISECYKTTSTGSLSYGDIDIDSDGVVTVYPWNNGSATIVNNYLFVSVEVDDNNDKHIVTTEYTNCTGDNLTEYTDGETVTITLTASEGCLFDDTPVISMSGETLQFNLSEDRVTATITFTIISDIVITGNANKYFKVETNLVNCYCDVTVVKGGIQTITVISNEGYEINSNIILFDSGTDLTYSYSDFTEDNTKCVITHDVQGDLRLEGVAVRKTDKLSSFANLYRINSSKLTELSKTRFYNSKGQIIDYGSFITQLYTLPFELDESMIADTGNIQLGNYDTGVKTDILTRYIYIYSFGSITVPEKYHNVYDYKDTSCILHLPYCDNITIETEYVVNHTITINYKVDLYSGKCTVNIYSDFINNVVKSKTFTIGSKIPFVQVQNNTTVGNIETVLDNDVFTPFIEVVRNIPYNVNSIFGNETVDFGILENYKGYLKVSDVILNINATNEDKNEIENLLKSGVFINEKNVDFSNDN